MKIAICEDNAKEAMSLKKLINNYYSENKISLEKVDVFDCGNDFLKNFRTDSYDIVFLDIFLTEKDCTGIDIGRAIRDVDANCQLVFTTISFNHAIDAIDLEATHYLTKPLTSNKVSEAVSRCIKKLNQKSHYIILNSGKTIRKVFLNDILFVEVRDNICTFYLREETFHLRLPLSEVENKIQETGLSHTFLRCNRCYLVNMEAIRSATPNSFIMENNEKLLIRQYRKNDVMKEYESFLFSQMRQ